MVETVVVSDIIPQNDDQRLKALHSLKILYTAAEETFDNITQMMAQVFDVPMSFISLVDKDRVFYKSKVGPFGDSVKREDSLCSNTILGSEPMVVEDASTQVSFQDGPYVAGEGGIRFYAGAPLTTKDGYHIGTVCIVDTQPRTFSERDKSLLVRFSHLVMHEIELRQADALQQEAEEALLKNQERFELVSNATHDAVWDWNLITDEIWWNEGFKTLFGYKEEDIESTIDSWYNRVHPDDKDRVVGGIHEVIDGGGKNWSDEYRFRRKDGSYASVLDRGYALHDENSKPYRMLGSMQDISVRRKQEEEIEAQNMLTRTMAENATSTLFMMNAKGYCTFMNKAGEAMFGYSQEEIRSKPLHYLIHHHRPDGTAYPMEECPIDRALPENFDVRAHRDHFFKKDGSSLKVTCAASPIFEGGVPVATVIEVRDITLELEAEEALRRSAQELERRVEERTRELRQVNEQLKQFSYSASHDLQEPLRKISFFTGKLLTNLGQDLSDENKKIAGRIVDTTDRMRTLIDDLLNYSNATLGATGFTEVSLDATVEAVLSDLEASIIEKGASIQFEGLPTVKGDSRQLRQLFQNLISNSLKYQREGVVPQVEITACVVKGEDLEEAIPAALKNDSFHLVQIRDNGIGFDPDDAERIFNLFQRLHGKAEYEGTGVGLAIVKKVIENHKGYIWAESQPGTGSTFRLLLPA